MKKMILSIIVIAILLFLGIGFYNASQLQQIKIRKTVEIETNLENTYSQVVNLKNFTNWSPFYEADPSQITRVEGTDGEVGAQFHWDGNEGKDLGYQEITEIRPLSYVRMNCTIEKPFKANPSFEYSFEKTGQGVKVTQDFHLESGLIDAFFMWLFGAKKDMANMNMRGLELLKKYCEEN